MKAIINLALLVLLGFGCMPSSWFAPKVEFVPTQMPTRSMMPRPVEFVDVFVTGRPARPYQEVALMKVQSNSYQEKTAVLVNALRTRAARAGCDAVIVTGRADSVVGSSQVTATSSVSKSPTDTTSTTSTTSLDTEVETSNSVHTRTGYWGACILWTDGKRVAKAAAKRAKRRTPPHRATLKELKSQVVEELLRDGISLRRLKAAVSLSRSKGTKGVTVALIDRESDQLLSVKRVKRLPQDQEAVVAHLVVVVRSMVDTMHETRSQH